MALIRQFLFEQLYPDMSTSSDLPLPELPAFHEPVTIHPSVLATFYAPSDICGTGGMRRERIRAISSWRKGPARFDTIFVCTDPAAEGMRGLDVARVRLFFSFQISKTVYPCALIHWFSRVGDSADEDTGMWVVKPDLDVDGLPRASVIHLDTILRAAHLIGVYGKHFLPEKLSFTQSLDIFRAYYVNKFIDHHAFEIAF